MDQSTSSPVSSPASSSLTSPSIKRSGIPKFSFYLNAKTPELAKALANKTPGGIDDQLQCLIEKTAETVDRNCQLENENIKLKEIIANLEKQVNLIQERLTKSAIESTNNVNYHKINESIAQLNKQIEIDRLTEQLKNQKDKYEKILYSNNKILKRLADTIKTQQKPVEENGNFDEEFLTTDEIESKINQYFINTDLQLYEANEKIIELLEMKTTMDDEIKCLKKENEKLTEVGKLVSTNMRETLNTNLLMEEKLIELRTEKKDFYRKSLDTNDSPSPIISTNDELQRLTIALIKTEEQCEKKLLDMQKQMEEEITRETNEKLKLYQIKLDTLEEELKSMKLRAESAENELKELRSINNSYNNSRFNSNDNLHNLNSSSDINFINNNLITNNINSSNNNNINNNTNPPPPPPPLPKSILPPPPPPMPNFILTPNTKQGLNVAGKLGGKQSQQQVKQATAIDAIVSEIKNGRVTLRKRRPPPPKENNNSPFLDEMFQLLEKSRKQNRKSKILIENKINIFLENPNQENL